MFCQSDECEMMFLICIFQTTGEVEHCLMAIQVSSSMNCLSFANIANWTDFLIEF